MADPEQHSGFARLARVVSRWTGSPLAALVLVVLTLVWVAAGAATDFPRAWELVGTVGVPLVTLFVLMGVQHTQDHDDLAMQLKVDELIRVMDGTRESMMNVEDSERDELEQLQERYRDKHSA